MSSSSVSGGGSTGLSLQYNIAVARKQSSMQKEQGQALVKLIEQSVPSTPTVAPGGNPASVGTKLNLVG